MDTLLTLVIALGGIATGVGGRLQVRLEEVVLGGESGCLRSPQV